MSKKRKAEAGLAAASGYAPVIVLPTTTPPENLAELKSAGYLVVLCDQPEKVIVKTPQGEIASGDLTMAVMRGLVSSGLSGPFETFTKELYARMLKREGA